MKTRCSKEGAFPTAEMLEEGGRLTRSAARTRMPQAAEEDPGTKNLSKAPCAARTPRRSRRTKVAAAPRRTNVAAAPSSGISRAIKPQLSASSIETSSGSETDASSSSSEYSSDKPVQSKRANPPRSLSNAVKSSAKPDWGTHGTEGEVKDSIDEAVGQDSFVPDGSRQKLPQIEAAPELLMPLLPYQKEFLAWAVNQEQGPTKGGLLADEMGMGKTIQAISVILTHREEGKLNVGTADHVRGLPNEAVASSDRPTVRISLGVAPDSSAVRLGKELHPNNSGMKPASLPQLDHASACGSHGSGAAISDQQVLDFCKTTLVVCPVVAMIQWKAEIARYCVSGSVKVLVYHGSRRSTISLDGLRSADFVLTTYGTLEFEHRKYMLQDKIECDFCGKKYFADRLQVHLRYFCGPWSKKTEAQAKQQKKSAQPQSKKRGGQGGAKISKRPKLSGKTSDSEGDPSDSFADYSWKEAAEKMMKDAQKKSSKPKDGMSMLHQIAWRRIVLDEAHCIKDRRSNTAKAVFALNARYRWGLSGTPLQNRVSELYSLVRFLRLSPYSYYFCRKCECHSLDYCFFKKPGSCDHCDHTPMQHFCWWNNKIANPIRTYGFEGKGATAMQLLRTEVLPKILLRRTKVQCADELSLPPRTVVVRKLAFDEREQDYYESLYTQSQAAFGTYVAAGTLVNNYAHIFDLLIRLRQAVNHPYLVIHSNAATKAQAKSSNGAPEQPDLSSSGLCGICHDPVEDALVAACGDSFCRSCIADYIDGSESTVSCPVCSKLLTVDLAVKKAEPAAVSAGRSKAAFGANSILNRIDLKSFQSSTKIEAVREELNDMLKRDPSAKCIIFSQFTSMLDLVYFRLNQVGIKTVKLTGSMSLQQRDDTITKFVGDHKVKCFLMSLKAGGVALNLTAASHVILLDPWWNPAVEQQAQDRIHRLGQYRPIYVTRVVIAGTIEERILKLQEKKQLVFEGTVGKDTAALGRLTEDDLRFLFA
mmetsp:Transcript_8330/g.23887  ORF Transcript_8330/g.23887 Transcript_8330/m.23887 type:complete len:988 (-) Transcript_8330:202-3165(-)|eukprot:CAMPEP_0117692922 /NCGR_PEP_ID=MMETSP0804-20121206/26585_1 /TAXON_ID=1074897 /ORGANISM="Tetraselmis astigmatica, Strain CCMP880" /LENGTH=987 /DNA_ID=CAMNT_0005506401 /DNA_START=125 /DNA_END=3088 /DNA_ORIENTATION=+